MARILSLCLAGLIAGIFASCGGDDDSDAEISAAISTPDLAACLGYAGFDASAGGFFTGGTGTGTITAETVGVGPETKPVTTVFVLSPDDAERLEEDLNENEGIGRFLGERVSSIVYVAGRERQGKFVDPSPPDAPSDVTRAVAECVE